MNKSKIIVFVALLCIGLAGFFVLKKSSLQKLADLNSPENSSLTNESTNESANKPADESAKGTANETAQETAPKKQVEAPVTQHPENEISEKAPTGNVENTEEKMATEKVLEKTKEKISEDNEKKSATESSVEKKEPGANCYAYEYRHLKKNQGKDIEDYLEFQNIFRLQHGPISEKDVCVKIEKKPVPFKLEKKGSYSEVVLGPIVGPETIVRVSYCVGPHSSKCKESCSVKSNRMMDDLISSTDDDFKDSWDNTDTTNQIKEKAKAFRSIASEDEGIKKQLVMRNWEVLSNRGTVCNR